MPIADYSAGIWGYKCYPKSETMQIRALRTFLGVNKFASSLAVNGDTGWPSMRIRRHLEMVRLWNRLVSMREDRLTKKVFNWDYKHDKEWSSETKLIFDKIGLAELYDSKSMCDRSIKPVINTVHEKLSETAQTQWRNSLQTQSKTKNYRLILKATTESKII